MRSGLRHWTWGVACVLAACAAPVWAVDPALTSSDDRILQTYEPITAGYTKDSGDVPYMDATLSLKVRLLPPDLMEPLHSRLYFAFTTRFGFYLGTRESAPVIGKSYNPKLIWRWMPDTDVRQSAQGTSVWTGDAQGGGTQEHAQYLDFAYAHESNGQTLSSADGYAREQREQERPEFANDYISRGWDYLEVVWKRSWFKGASADASGATTVAPLATYLDLQYFLPRGLLQGRAEEYNSWEASADGKPRKAVDGITAIAEYQSHWRWGRYLPSNPSFWLKYKTGYDSPFKYSTVRGEAGVEIAGLPVVLWAQNGYMQSLANYYRRTTSFGLELRFGEF